MVVGVEHLWEAYQAKHYGRNQTQKKTSLCGTVQFLASAIFAIEINRHVGACDFTRYITILPEVCIPKLFVSFEIGINR